MKKKMQGLFMLALMAAALPGLASCSIAQKGVKPSDNYVTKSYKFGEINGIAASAGVTVMYTQGEDVKPVMVEGPENVVAALEVKLDQNNTLVLGFPKQTFKYTSDKQHAHVFVSSPDAPYLNFSSGSSLYVKDLYSTESDVTLEASSGAEVTADGICCPKMSIAASSGAEVDMKMLEVQEIGITASSGAEVDACGTAETVAFTASSGAEVDADKLVATAGAATASSGGSISCNIKQATVTKSSGGEVKNVAN